MLNINTVLHLLHCGFKANITFMECFKMYDFSRPNPTSRKVRRNLCVDQDEACSRNSVSQSSGAFGCLRCTGKRDNRAVLSGLQESPN